MKTSRVVKAGIALLVLLAGSVAAFAQVGVSNLPDTDEQRIADMIQAYKICVNEGILDSYGHISVRSKTNPNHFYMPRAMPPSLVTRKDIVELDLNSVPVDQKAPRTNGERYIHGEIYKVRPDVQSVIHAHTQAVIPFSLAGVTMHPVVAQAGFLFPDTPLFDSRLVQPADAKERGMLVRTAPLGASLAKTLGQSPVVLMRGHGMTIVADSARRVAFQAVYTQINANMQFQAMLLNRNVNAMDAQELKYNPTENFDVERPWDNFVSRVEGKR